jgi:imidazolonepropionase-like amidohydrolase
MPSTVFRPRRWLGLLALIAGCAGSGAAHKPATPPAEPPKLDVPIEWVDPLAFTPPPRPRAERARPSPKTVVIRHATLLTATGRRIDDGALLLEGGKITAIGPADLPAPPGAVEIDGRGKFVTPGIIDTHSHIGVYRVPTMAATEDGNEATAPTTAQAAAEYGYDAQDPAISRAVAGGVTAAQILPGSANLIGGRGVVVEMRPGAGIDDVRFPGAPMTVKMACGENPKRVYGEKGGPSTRMGEYAAFRAAFQGALDYERQWQTYRQRRAQWESRRAEAERRNRAAAPTAGAEAGAKTKIGSEEAPPPPSVDAGKALLAGVLRGEVLAQVHCYTSNDILQMLAIADEFGFRVRSFHHALEAYKIRDVIVSHGAAISTWADWWGFKLEAFDGIPENAALFAEQGGMVAIHSDSNIEGQRLNQEAAKAMAAGRAAGVPIDEDKALRWITAEPAWILGIDKLTGSLEVGKRADVVVWDRSPFSVYALPELVFIAGAPAYDRAAGRAAVDFELGTAVRP